MGRECISKDSPKVEVCGTLDELNSFLGLARACVKNKEIRETLKNVQEELFLLGADLITPLEKNVERISGQHVRHLEEKATSIEEGLEELNRFIIPGGCLGSAALHIARTVCRRAERSIVALKRKEKINEEAIRYMNRLSDLLFVLARKVNRLEGEEEEFVNP